MRIIIIICHWFQPLEDYQPGLERGRWAEPAVQKWVSCFHHSRPFPTTSTTSTTACWHGELHLTRRAPSHTESSISPRRPADTESSISPWRPAVAPLYHSLTATATGLYYVLNCQLRAMRKKHTRPFRALRPFRAHPVCVWNGGLTESTAGVHYLHRVLD